MLQLSDQLCGLPLHSLQPVHVFLVLRIPELDAALQVGSHKGREDSENYLTQPDDQVYFETCHALLSHVDCFIHKHPQNPSLLG